MTEEERAHLDSLDASKIKRIARGSARSKDEVTAMVKEFLDKK